MSNSNQGGFPKPSQDQLKTIITNAEGAQTLVECAEGIGKALANNLKTSQIRIIFGEVRRIEGDWKTNPQRANRSLILLKPKMAYQAKRSQDRKDRGVNDLVSVLTPAIDCVQSDKDNFSRFVNFFEAILAYHKAHGGN